MLEAEGLAKRYGDVWAVRDVTLTLEAGECLVLLGRNGAGKTTALRCLAGVIRPSAGRIRIGGLDATTEAADVRARVGLMPEVPGLYERMSARAYLDYFGAVYGITEAERHQRIGDLLDYFELSHAGDRWLGTFSKGMRQKVALIRATLHRPKLVLADEPTSALDPASAANAWRYLKELQAAGSGLVICTHSMEEAESLAGRVGIMAGGQLLADGDLAYLRGRSGLKLRKEVRQLPTLQDIYMAIVGTELDDQAESA
jgi:ABC-2 type transport system ATP-binding protein